MSYSHSKQKVRCVYSKITHKHHICSHYSNALSSTLKKLNNPLPCLLLSLTDDAPMMRGRGLQTTLSADNFSPVNYLFRGTEHGKQCLWFQKFV